MHAETASTQSPESLVSTVTREIQRLNDVSGDPLFRRELDLLRVRALFDAASIAHQRGQPAQARELATQAIHVIGPLLESREWSPADKYLIGRLYFFVGSSIAVSNRDHGEATKFYEHARSYFSLSPPQSFALDLGRHGERFVSMGASYFESGNRELGMRLTREGLETMREAAESGLIKEESLALPYTNLAAMYKVLGKSEESQELVEMASRIHRSSDSNRR
jgi:tetratricopeptide (TPR) repeat protein